MAGGDWRLAGRGPEALVPGVTGEQVREHLAAAGVRPSRQLGQNFLCDPSTARWIVEQLEPGPGDAVVEVGPGTGALSEQLLGRVRRLILIEFDARLAEWLRKRFADDPRVEVHHADAARFDPRVLWKHRPLKFLGNLPYSSGGAIMRNLLARPHPFSRAVVMLQKEVVERMVAVPRTKDYGVLSLRVQGSWKVRPLRTVPPDVFHPRPQVDSAVAVMEPLTDELPVFNLGRFDELVRRGFAQRRKQLHKQLPAELPWTRVADEIGVSPTARAEELDLRQWVELSRRLDPGEGGGAGQSGDECFDVVDEDDVVVGREKRSVVHARGLMHRAVHVFLVNRRGELLIQKRSRLKDAHPGVWDSSVAGHLDAGEDYHDAAIREMEEEMGVSGVEIEELGRLKPSEASGWEHVVLYLGRWEGRPRFPCDEIESVLWMPADELDAWITACPDDFAGGFLECWKLARGRA